MKYFFAIGLLLVIIHLSYGQKNVAITLDDVPNTIRYKKDFYDTQLLDKLDSLSIPIAIFVNEGLLYKGDSVNKNFELFDNWLRKEYITFGNHTFAHSRYSESGIDSFKVDIIKGEYISLELSKVYHKPLVYFRFPYNDLGKDSLQHLQIRDFLSAKGYILTPFTIESSDWMYNMVYEYYLERGQIQKAKEIGFQYVDKALEYFDFFDKFSKEKYGRSINQIYLCHDNKLNTDFLELIIQQLEKKNYSFISLKEALSDKVYEQDDFYFKKWGISWLYRWLETQNERIKYMKQEPSTAEIETLFNSIN